MKKLLAFLVCAALIVFLPWIIISLATFDKVYTSIDVVPTRTYGLLLGTTPGPGGDNLFFTTRIEATKELYERGKIRYVIVSGDNANGDYYNEPAYMRNALLRAGVPDEAILIDNAGYRTLDSVIRLHDVFSVSDDVIIISQPFHVERALFLARVHGIDAIGYGAANVSLSMGIGTYVREIGARWLALYDAYFGTKATEVGTGTGMTIEGQQGI